MKPRSNSLTRKDGMSRRRAHKPPKHIKRIYTFSVRLSRAWLVVAGSILVAVLLLAGTVLGYQQSYAGRMFPGVKILGVDVGGRSYVAALELVSQRSQELQGLPIIFVYPNGMHEELASQSLGLEIDVDALTSTAYLQGRSGSILDQWADLLLATTSETALAFSPEVDEATLLELVEPKLTQFERSPKNASFTIAEAGLAIQPSEAGVTIQRAGLIETIRQTFEELALPAVIPIPWEEIQPEMTETVLEPILVEANRLTSVPVIFEGRDRRVTADQSILETWLVIDETAPQIRLGWDETKMIDFLKTRVAKAINVPMRPKRIERPGERVLEEGQVGYQLDQKAAIAAVKDILSDRQALSRLDALQSATLALQIKEIPIEEQSVAPVFTPGLYPGKYVEVNLTEQKLFQWNGAELLGTYTVSTGKWSTPTPEGVLYVKNHISYAYSKKYDLYMPWWLGMARNPDGSGYEGYGIHELPEWRGGVKEGQSHLGTPVSHGCIRLGIGDARTIYDWAEEGMPVYIHK